MILDDIFSGLDTITEDHIFSRLLGTNGLLRQLGTTIILVTHAAHRLSFADHIIALSAEGTVSEQGKFEDLVANDGYVSRLASRHISEADRPEDAAAAQAKVDDETARQNAAADIYRPVGNWETYKYYFASLGWRNFGVWMCLMLFYSLLVQFPSRCLPS